MNKIKRLQLISLSALLLMLHGCGLNPNRTSNKEETNNNGVYEELNNKYVFHYYNDTYDVESAINRLGITRNDDYPYGSYRYILYLDNSHIERYEIVIGYANYIVNEEGNVIDTIYDYYNAFTNEYVFSTRNIKDINSFESDKIYHTMEFGKLCELRDSVISKGLDRDYAYSVVKDDIKNKVINTSEAARIYVLLVNSFNRIESNHQIR